MTLTADQEAAIAKAIEDLRTRNFQTKTTEAAMKIADGIQLGVTKPKLVYSLGHKLVVKVYLGGKQRVIRFFEGTDYDLAYRFADLMVRRFAGLGQRKSKTPLTEDSYNLTLTQVQHDNDNESDIIQGFIHLEAALPDPASFKQKRRSLHERLDTIEKLLKELSESQK